MTATVAPSFRILRCERTIEPSLINKLKDVPTPNISDSLGKLSPAGAGLKPMHAGGKMIGRAVTARVPAGDNLLAYKAILDAAPGDVLVIDADGSVDRATIGEIMTTLAASRGLAGIVVYGAVRDVDILGSASFPVFACGYTHRGPYRNGPGELNVTVSIGGMLVSPGDLVVGDANGVICVPFEDVAHVAQVANEIKNREDSMVSDIESGRYDARWLEAALKERGYSGEVR